MTDLQEWKVTVGYDDALEDPFIWTDFTLIDFRCRHSSDDILNCVFEDDDDICEQGLEEHTGKFFRSYLYMNRHEFIADSSIVGYLDFSGGSSAGIRWYLTEGTCNIPGDPALYDPNNKRFSYRQPAGVLIWNDYDGDLFWKWLKEQRNAAKQSIEQARDALDTYVIAALDEYNKWASGETYWFTVERLNGDGDYEEVDSCGGYYGWDHMKDGLSETVPEQIVKAEDWELVEAYY